ncbi:MAG: DNA starvation/stationary phase protection protein [Elusimicrobia bacterium]|nr:DNA starvation/stationary phase protection protein [Elusimicrobiota bacterium]
MKTVTLTEDDRKGVAHILNENLCDEYVLYTKTRNFHWNVTGPDFSELHAFFRQQYQELDEIVDKVAERARTTGGWALGTLAEFGERTRLKEMPGTYPDAPRMLAELASDHEAIARRLRNDIATCEAKYHDPATANFLTEMLEEHEKMAWMLTAHVTAAPGEKARSFVTGGRDIGG